MNFHVFAALMIFRLNRHARKKVGEFGVWFFDRGITCIIFLERILDLMVPP